MVEEGIMEEKLELVVHIHKDAAMGVYTTKTLMDKLKDKDNKIKSYVEEIHKKYEEYVEKSKSILLDHDIHPEEDGMVSKMMASMGISKEVKDDNSDSAISDLLIQGISMGVIEMEKKLKSYSDECDKEYIKLAKDFMKFQEKTIDELKKYL